MSQLIKRTFAAAKYPKGSEERTLLNGDAATSEYLPSYRYLVRKPFIMRDGTQNPVQKYIEQTFRTKAEAEAKIAGGGA
jgi:hypothetical protein